MDNIAYLNYISNKPKQASSFSKKKLKLIIIASVSLIALIILISIISNISKALSARETDFSPRLAHRVENLNKLNDEYLPKLKSSELRAEGAQLTGTLKSIINDLPTYFQKTSTDYKPIYAEEDETLVFVKSALENGRINGDLDRTYARYFAYYTAIIISLSKYNIKQSSDSALKSYLEQKIPELEKKYQYFSDFTGAIN